MDQSRPLVSVVLPVFNGGFYLREAIDSILAQSYENFELIILNDGSTDETARIASGCRDPRVRYHEHANVGLSRTLNIGLGLSRGRYIARQDHDDISLPHRIEKQVGFLECNPDVGLLGTWAEIWRDNSPTGREHRHSIEDKKLRLALLFDNPFVHSSVMFRAEIIKLVSGYSTATTIEDFELWSRMASVTRLANLPEVHLRYREVEQSLSRRQSFGRELCRLSAQNLARALDRDEPDATLDALSRLYHREPLDGPEPTFSEISVIVKSLAAHPYCKQAGVAERHLFPLIWDLYFESIRRRHPSVDTFLTFVSQLRQMVGRRVIRALQP